MTLRTGYIGNTFGPNGFSSGSSTRVAQIIIHKANQPDAVLDFFYAYGLTGKDRAEIDFFLAETNAAAMRNDNRSVVEWIVDGLQSLVRTRRSLKVR